MTEDRIIDFVAPNKGDRLDKLLVGRTPEISRSALQKLIDAGAVTVNAVAVKSNYRTRIGDLISARIPPSAADTPPAAEAIALDIVFQDEYLLVINKPAGMVVHPAAGHAWARSSTHCWRWRARSMTMGSPTGPGSCTGSTRRRPAFSWSPRAATCGLRCNRGSKTAR